MIEFFVPGVPMPKGSKTAIVRGSRAVLLDARRPRSRAAYDAWKESLRAHAVAWVNVHKPSPSTMVGLARDAAVGVDLTFFVPRPIAAKRRAHPSRRPDLDKLCRAVLDGIAPAQLIWDDSRVVELVARKQYADARGPGALVRIWSL